MFLGIERHPPEQICARSDSGQDLSYGALCDAARQIGAVTKRGLAFLFSENSIGSLCGYVGFLSCGVVPLMVDRNLDAQLLSSLLQTYRPAYFWLPQELAGLYEYPCILSLHGYCLLETGADAYPLHEELALLITTSGSTGSPKLVRQSEANLRANATSIVEYLELSSEDRAITTLPMSYVYGLSVINSHLLCGGMILMTTKGILQKEFWSFFREGEATNFGGVPYTYEMLKRLRFSRMDLPSLTSITQAGGKLSPELHLEFATWAKETNRRFYVMYGASEATARMGYLPHDKAVEKYGSMGLAIPGGTLSLVDEQGQEITAADTVGELVYRGENVTLGYAEKGEDLALGDERKGVLFTGDMARRDADGFYYIVGRKKRFLKIFGNRVSLDEVEQMLKTRFEGMGIACDGVDDLMTIFATEPDRGEDLRAFAAEKTGLHPSAFRVIALDEIPKNSAGKTLYAELRKLL